MLALLLAATAALGLTACGGGDNADLLPGGTASEINSNLDRVQALVGEGECVGAEEAALEVRDQIDALGGVDQKLKQALSEGATRLTAVVEECVEAPEEETEPAIETAVEPEADEKEKPRKADKPEKEKPDEKAEEAPAATTPPSLPPQAEGEAKGHEESEEAPPAESGDGGTSSGGVGPGVEAGGE
jgi:outer membrane biosynthesis protein TonB